MKEHTETMAGAGANSVTDGESSISELMARIERQCEIIGDLLVTNEHLRHRLRSIEYSAQARSTQHSKL